MPDSAWNSRIDRYDATAEAYAAEWAARATALGRIRAAAFDASEHLAALSIGALTEEEGAAERPALVTEADAKRAAERAPWNRCLPGALADISARAHLEERQAWATRDWWEDQARSQTTDESAPESHHHPATRAVMNWLRDPQWAREYERVRQSTGIPLSAWAAEVIFGSSPVYTDEQQIILRRLREDVGDEFDHVDWTAVRSVLQQATAPAA
ncbi:hypothetical protein [Streptomyces sp. SM12]|uniref:hypothetical protein n=1 Tax=Streptomyces sp. SM12 TaxID=1071602 RepID=UPI000CD52843|nr:hypothetical protein [Streptomyces sp. SM12]